MAKGLLMLLGKPKAGASKDAPAVAPSEEGPELEYAREAFSALKDGDEEGFVEAFISAVKACASKAGKGGYDDEEA